MTFLKQLAETRRLCPNGLHRRLLSDAHEEVAGRLFVMQDQPTTANMKALVGAWTRAAILMARVDGPVDGGGSKRQAA